MVWRVDVYLVLWLLDRRRHALRRELEPIGTARDHRFVSHPDERRLELVGRLGRRVGCRDDIAARAVDLVRERQRDRLARNRLFKIAVERDDAVDRRRLAARTDATRVPGPDLAACALARNTPEIEVRTKE